MIGKLYSFRRCPYAIRARLILAFANLKTEIIEVDLKNKPESLLHYSKKATVPVLVLQNNQVIDESLDIMDWVCAHHYPKDWSILSEDKKKLGSKLLEDLHNQFIPALNRYKYASLHTDVDLEIEETTILQYFDQLLSTLSTTYLLDENPSYYDIAIFPFIRQANIANSNWLQREKYQMLNEWFTRLLTSSIFESVMRKA